MPAPAFYKVLDESLTRTLFMVQNDFDFIDITHIPFPVFFRKGKNSRILTDLSLRFFNTEVNVKRHLQGIVSKGWISGQSVDPHYFKLLDSSVSSKPPKDSTPKIEYSQPVALHMNPAEGSRLPMELVTSNINNVVHKKTKMEQNQTASNNNDEPPPKQFYLQCICSFEFSFIFSYQLLY